MDRHRDIPAGPRSGVKDERWPALVYSLCCEQGADEAEILLEQTEIVGTDGPIRVEVRAGIRNGILSRTRRRLREHLFQVSKISRADTVILVRIPRG